MQAPLLLFPTRHDGEGKCTPGLNVFREECSLPINPVEPPTTVRPPSKTGPFLLGCGQATPSSCLRPLIVDQQHLDVVDRHDFPSLPIIYECHSPNPDQHVVNHPVHDLHDHSTTVHATRSEIAPSLININLSAHFYSTITHSATLDEQDPTITRPFNLRSLTAGFNEPHDIMTTIPSAPGSPPDLSGSRSSASSSSYCSSTSPNGGDGIGTDITHYEDISLDDVRPTEKPQVRSTVTERRPPSHSNPSRVNAVQPNLGPQIREAVMQHEQTRRQKNRSFTPLRRGFTMQTLPLPHEVRPRSASPPKRLTRVHSTSVMNATQRPEQGLRASLPLPPRTSSWQPRRKSVQELEAECNESDEDLPDDASLWNVPVSPHPGPGSSRSSLIGTPNRSPVLSSARPIPLDHARTAPESPPRLRNTNAPPARHRNRPPRSSSAHNVRPSSSSPNMSQFRRVDRARSWNMAMGELSEEARIISESLEYHAAQQTKTGEPPAMRTRPATDKREVIQLPPIQKGNLDFMPISKEKEAVLSRTRPSWLPPKDPREEQKHLKEYQRMMAASLEAERRRQSKQLGDPGQKDTTREALARIWTYYCDDNTDVAQIDKRVYSLCWHGITARHRGKAWKRGIGNRLGLTIKSYEKALERAHQIQGTSREHLSERERCMNRWFRDIERDAETAFPELNMFQQKGPLWQDLVNVCKAYTCYRSDVGYVYGLQLVGALLLLQLPTAADVFVVLANAMNRGLSLAFQSGDFAMMTRTYSHAVSTLAIKFPRLHEYLLGSMEQGGLGFAPEQIFEPMFRTLFTNGLDVDRLCRVWDIWVFEGDKILVHTAVALIGTLQSQLFDVQGDVDLKRRNIQEMLAWGPFNRTKPGEYWDLNHVDEDAFVEDVKVAGKLDYRGK